MNTLKFDLYISSIMNNFTKTLPIAISQLAVNGRLLRHIENPTIEQCDAALVSDVSAVEFVPVKYQNQTVCKYVIETNATRGFKRIHPDALTPELRARAIELDKSNIAYVPDPTELECLIALKSSLFYLYYIDAKFFTESLALKLIEYYNDNILLKAIVSNTFNPTIRVFEAARAKGCEVSKQ